MPATHYKTIATNWSPESRSARSFQIITIVFVLVFIVAAIFISSLDVPKKERKAKQPVPERVAKFITEKKKVEPPKPKPKEIEKPKPIPKPKPKVVRKKETEAEKKKPLTKKEKDARDKASKSGLLALASEMADLMDTSDVSAQVGAKVKKSTRDAKEASGVDSDILTAGVGKGSGGVNDGDYVAGVNAAQLDAREVALVKQSLLKSDQVEKDSEEEAGIKRRGDNVRSEEEVTIVFDQNKGQLYSIYNRARRKQPGLKGKVVLEISISPEGKVTNVSVKSSELNDPKLERRLIARIKQFKFEAKDVEPVTVTFPIEFLPS